ncbi:DUF1214 domain-containing protein [Parvularcula marina]|uniref:DUF1214 domain-containing protein n=1 Tax=Parvularcula marina TaxID=2292771 RepID=A0A371RFQ4_9PROT|nr:DUF1214 domain-containing protein [Parvularcula marina]RFB04260.1 DUF1214 domain-containing protein [Parvularcula marina]
MTIPHWNYARWGLAVVIALCAFWIGTHQAHSAMKIKADVETFVFNGPWYTDDFGAKEATPMTRAYTAVVGLLALSRQETLYYMAREDSDGEPMTADYVYEITGGDLPSRWWSITLYGDDHFLLDNEYGKFSVKATDLEREEDGTFKVVISREPQPGNWIPMAGEAGEEVSLLLRMYNPNDGVLDRLQDIDMPEIRRVRKAS